MPNNEDYKKSPLYQEFTAEREEILKHKWLESEKANRDVGFEWALTDWIIHHRSKWRRARISAGYGVQPRGDTPSNRTALPSSENRPIEKYQISPQSLSSIVEERVT